ncbi:MAG: WYL domain-containing protein [Frankiaceae bacterium]
MSATKTERLLNLVLALLSTRRWLSFAQIRSAVPGYDGGDVDSARRTFERDKAELRELGIPLETGSSSAWDDEPGYRIARRDYELPEVDLAPDEAAAVGLAARLWAEAGLAADASRALLKLRAAGIDVDGPQLPGLEPRVDAAEPAFEALVDAATTGRPVSFDYRSTGATAASRRRLEPWGVVSWRGAWYVVGQDLDRAERRIFRLSRVAGPVRPIGRPGSVRVPAGIALNTVVRELVPDLPERSARLQIRAGAGYELRRRAERSTGSGPGWDEVVVRLRDRDAFADEVVGHGSAVVVLDPPDVRDAVVARLRTLARTRA